MANDRARATDQSPTSTSRRHPLFALNHRALAHNVNTHMLFVKAQCDDVRRGSIGILNSAGPCDLSICDAADHRAPTTQPWGQTK